MGVPEKDPLSQLSLPPGFRFFPTDEELLVQYLCRKVAGHHFSLPIIGDIDLYKFDPWVLPSKAMFGEKEWYFFSPRDRKYPNGSRPNRVAGSGYWKATGTDKIISTEGRRVGIKKALVFYVGKAPKGTKTNWIMHEYRLIDSFRKIGSTKLDEWVLCRIYKKNSSSQKLPTTAPAPATSSISSLECSNGGGSPSTCSSLQLDDVMEVLPDIEDRFLNFPRVNSINFNSFDWAFEGLNSVAELAPQTHSHVSAPGIVNNSEIMYFPAAAPPQKPPEQEVQSGSTTQRLLNSRAVYESATNSGWLQQNFSNSGDGFGF